jgi:hypothetical protein
VSLAAASFPCSGSYLHQAWEAHRPSLRDSAFLYNGKPFAAGLGNPSEIRNLITLPAHVKEHRPREVLIPHTAFRIPNLERA